jgi:hypothetical protein
MLAQAHPAITARALGCDRERRSRCPQLSGGGRRAPFRLGGRRRAEEAPVTSLVDAPSLVG